MNYCGQCGSQTVRRMIPLGDIGIRFVCEACGVTHYQNPNVVAGCLAVRDGKILLCRRAIEPFVGKWTVPAGYLELGETVEEAARRETLEESGARVSDLRLFALYNLPMFGEVYILYIAKLVESELLSGSETEEARLFARDEIPWTELAFPMVREALSVWSRRENGYADPMHTADFLWGPEGAVRVRRPVTGHEPRKS